MIRVLKINKNILWVSLFAAQISVVNAQGILATLLGGELEGEYGKSAVFVGDVNKDGVVDLLIGAPSEDPNGSNSGSAYVLSGADFSQLYQFNGPTSNDRLGYSVAAPGDVNNDSYPDFLIGAYLANPASSGDAYVYSGADGTLLYTFSGTNVDDYYGVSVSAAGDVNKDGYADLMVGAYRDDTVDTDAGKVEVLSGLDGAVIYTFYGASAGDNLSAHDGGQDVNGDGYTDFLVSAKDVLGANKGVVNIYSGQDGTLLYSFYGVDKTGFLSGLSFMGDLNQDGYAEFALKHYEELWIRSGIDGSVMFYYPSPNYQSVLREARDVNADGYPDFLRTDSTELFVHSGLDGAVIYNHSLPNGPTTLDAGDLNNDGYWDYLVGNSLDSKSNLYHSGSVTLFSGAALWSDFDSDGQNDHVDTDDDNDGVLDQDDLFPLDNSQAGDMDADGIGSFADNCDAVYNPVQLDLDSDNKGNLCDDDIDDDGDAEPNVTDSRPYDPLVTTADTGILFTVKSESVSSSFGKAVSTVGDVNGDGYADWVAGAPGDDANGNNAGKAFVYSGNDRSILHTFTGVNAGDGLGENVAGAGDVNNDGYGDILLKTGSRYIKVYSGFDFSLLWSFSGASGACSCADARNKNYGYAMATAGDINNDGYDDFLFGDPEYTSDDYLSPTEGQVLVYSGKDGGLIYGLVGSSNYEGFGHSVDGAGDINNDGYDDFVVGIKNHSNGGAVRIYSGLDGSTLQEWYGLGDYFGATVVNAGDMNADGYTDFAVGAPSNSVAGGSAGRVQVLSSKDGVALYTFWGDGVSDRLGSELATLGDVNNDGYDDIAIGAYQDDNGGVDSGSVRVISGIDGSILYVFSGENSDDQLGYSISALGDQNADGYADILVGIPNYGDDMEGAVRGYNGAALWTDTDSDGTNDSRDLDDDGDSYQDFVDAFPLDGTEWSDLDRDGIGDNSDADADGDGIAAGDNCPFTINVDQTDTDADGQGDACDADDDNDGVADVNDSFPLDPSEWLDLDGDGIGDNSDPDPDGDGFYAADNCFWVYNPDQSDTDGDGIGDVCDAPNAKNDTDADGDSDVIWRDSGSGAMTVWVMENLQLQSSGFIGGLGVDYDLVDSSDLDADGDADLVLFHSGDGKAIAWTMENNAKLGGALLAGFPGYTIRGLGDLDADGDADIVWQAESWGGVIVWIMEGGAKQSGSFIGSLGAGSVVEAMGDFDNDGDADLIWSVPGTDSLVRWDMENGLKSAGSAIGGFSGYRVSDVGDYNNDGIDDLLWSPDSGGSSSIIWLMLDGNKDSGLAVGTLPNYTIATTGDYDGDGDDDILWNNINGHTIVWEIENGAKVTGSAVATKGADAVVRP